MFLAEAYYEGKLAYREGWGRDECPYPPFTDAEDDWISGYDDAEGEASM